MAAILNSDAALEVSDKAEYMYYLREAEIAKFADFAGISIDEAVKIRVEQAVAEATPKMEITARPITPQGNLYGFASVTIGGVRVDDFKIVENKDGELFVGMPSKPDKSSQTGYRNTVHVDKDFKDDFSAAVIGAYHSAVEQAKDRAASMKTAPDKPPRIADQMAKAEKEAERHNTGRSAPAKSADKNADR